MPKRGVIDERSVEIRNKILSMCKEPLLVEEMMRKLRFTRNQVACHLRPLIKSKHIKYDVRRDDMKGRLCDTFIATGLEYDPTVAPVPAPEKEVVEVPETHTDNRPVIMQVNDYTRKVFAADYVKTKGAAEKINIRVGSTLGSMSF